MKVSPSPAEMLKPFETPLAGTLRVLLDYEPRPSRWPGGDSESQALILEMQMNRKKDKGGEERRWETLARGRGSGRRKGIDGFVHLSIGTVPQGPQRTAGSEPGWEQAKQLTWPTSAVRRKAATCLRPLQHRFGLRQANNGRDASCHSKPIRTSSPAQNQATRQSSDRRCHCGCGADASPSEALSAPQP